MSDRSARCERSGRWRLRVISGHCPESARTRSSSRTSLLALGEAGVHGAEATGSISPGRVWQPQPATSAGFSVESLRHRRRTRRQRPSRAAEHTLAQRVVAMGRPSNTAADRAIALRGGLITAGAAPANRRAPHEAFLAPVVVVERAVQNPGHGLSALSSPRVSRPDVRMRSASAMDSDDIEWP